MLSPRFLRVYAEKCRRSAQVMNNAQSAAELEVMARDLEDWANDPAGRTLHATQPTPHTASRADLVDRAVAPWHVELQCRNGCH